VAGELEARPTEGNIMAEVQQDKLGSTEDTLRFLDMVGLFGTQAMIALGKLANPATGKATKNMPAARLFIDTLEMLEHKTKGNLNSDETKVLHATLTDLRLMFVEESKAPEKTDVSAGASAKAEDRGQKAETAGSEAGGPSRRTESTEVSREAAPEDPTTTDDPKVKFHKKYE
jgi:hypothetical protein